MAAVSGFLRRTGIAIRGALSRRDGKAITVIVTLLYALVYAFGIGHLGRRSPAGPGADRPLFDLVVVSDPVSTALRQTAPFQYEAIALVSLGSIEFLVAPVNVLIGGALAGLVGVTMAVSVVAWRGPSACRIGPGTGAAAGLPGLLTGFVCCGPTILLVIGIQASTGLLIAMQWLVPIAVVLLVGTLLWVGSHVEPSAATE